jgi:hypothetical protein
MTTKIQQIKELVDQLFCSCKEGTCVVCQLQELLAPVEPLLNKDGSLKQVMVKMGGKTFRCEQCNCNVFHHPDKNDLDLYACNGCDTEYRGAD